MTSLRADARRRIKTVVLDLAAGGATGRALAVAVERACPWDDAPRRRAWQAARRALVGGLRHVGGEAREYAGVMVLTEGGDG